MPREKECYRDNLELILQAFPNNKQLTIADVAKWMGRHRDTIKKYYFMDNKKYLSPAELARRMS